MRKTRKYTSKYVNEAVALYRGGMSCQQVSRRIRVPFGTVRGWIQRAGVMRERKDSMRRAFRTPARIERDRRIVTLYTSGMSVEDVADIVGLYHSNVCRILRREGVKLRKGGNPGPPLDRDVRIMRAISMRADGLAWDEIGPKVGYSPGYIKNLVGEHRRRLCNRQAA